MLQVSCMGVTQQEHNFPEEVSLNNAETFMVYMARVSNPENQKEGPNPERLLRYCLNRKHWSVFEMVDMVVEIICPRDISRQIIRHPSFRFQEFSQRYAEVTDFTYRECRLQAPTNRQSSIPVIDQELIREWDTMQQEVLALSLKHYKAALKKGVAKEVARVLLPEGLTLSRMYMKGSVRSWIHYCEARTKPEAQKEHRDVAIEVWKVFQEQFPVTAKAVEMQE